MEAAAVTGWQLGAHRILLLDAARGGRAARAGPVRRAGREAGQGESGEGRWVWPGGTVLGAIGTGVGSATRFGLNRIAPVWRFLMTHFLLMQESLPPDVSVFHSRLQHFFFLNGNLRVCGQCVHYR